MTIGSFNFPALVPGLSGMAGSDRSRMSVDDEGGFTAAEIEGMANACLQSLEAALYLVDRWRRSGHGLEAVYLDALAPCARLLGQWWCCDTASFAQVTIASSNLQRLLHRLSPEFCAPGADRPAGLSLLLATEPQTQHTMGAFMLAEFFRRRGWRVQLLAPQDVEEVLDQLRRDWFDAVGLSVSTTRQLPALQQLLPRLRAQSPNPKLAVLLGGPLRSLDPTALQSLDVDLLGGDARDTVNSLSQLLSAKNN